MKKGKQQKFGYSALKNLKFPIRSLWFFTVIFLFATLDAFCIGFAPVRNFTRYAYSAGSQNWDMIQDPLGRVYFANRDGLLKYDGLRWSLFYLPNYTTVRTVYADDTSGSIYVGGSGEFGYFHQNPNTLTLRYESLASSLPEKERNFTEIWNIHKIGNGVYAFQGDFKVFVFNGTKPEVLNSKEKITASGFIGGSLLVGTQTGELLQYRDHKLTEAGRLPQSTRIVALLPFEGGKILVVTSSEGLYVFESGKMAPLSWDISSFLKDNQTFCATCRGSSYAFGTVNNGAVVKDIKTGNATYINKQTGLQNNTVLGLGFDYSANLWLCLDNGVSYAMVDSPVFNLLGNESEAGAGYASLLSNNRLLLATNRGLYSTPYPFTWKESPPVLTRLHSGQVWSLDSVGDDIFVSADDGLFALKGSVMTSPHKIPGLVTGNWYVAPLRSRPGLVLASAYDGFYLIGKERGEWRVINRISGYEDGGGKFIEDKEGTIWFAHWIKGLYRLTLSPDLKSFSDVRLYTAKDGLPSERENSITLYNGDLVIATASGEFYHPDQKGVLKRHETLSSSIPLKNSAHLYTLPSGISFTFSPKSVWQLKPANGGGLKIDSVSLRMVANSIIPGFEHVGVIDNDNVLVSNQEGFYNINIHHNSTEKWKNNVFVESLASGDSIIFSGPSKEMPQDLSLPYSLNSLTFNFAAPEYRSDNAVLYSCCLENYDKEWSTPSETASKEYTQLNEGDYTLRIKALNTISGETSIASIGFSILAPWYRSVPAKIFYGLLIIFSIYAGYLLIRNLSQRNARKMEKEKEAEMEMMRKEAEKEAIIKDYEIASLKSEQLELDIKHKSSELSNTTMNVIRKNEILLDISSRLKRINEKADIDKETSTGLKKEIDKIQALIHDNISHDDDWKKFNQNFDIVYADFTRHLAERHPNLTVAEKRLCCYLKMGLSSKEIAPIFSISPKSVEMNRYRLRQKLGMERSDNLVEYLQGI